MISYLYLLLYLLIHNWLPDTYFTVSGHPLKHSSDWTSVQRTLVSPDTVYLSSCSKSCQIFPGMNSTKTVSGKCSCECKKPTPTFLPSAKACVSRLDECWKQIRFETSDPNTQWIPTFTIPSTDNIFAPSNKISWNEAKVKFLPDGRVNCTVHDTFVQTDGLWAQKNGSKLFQLQVFNQTTFLKWVGDEDDALSLQGSVVQVKLTCSKYANSAHCIAFRIAGLHVNTNSLYHLSEREWNRIELIVCFLLSILLILTIFGSVIMWSVCWRMKKGKLIANIHTQFLFHLKQQQLYMEEQIATIRASCVRQVERDMIDERMQIDCPTKRKLYFNSEFFEPEVMSNPPPVAQQFILELRKMVDLAKERIKLKRHTPTLDSIKEEECEDEKYLEIAPPDCSEKTRLEGSSPKSTKSTDSGVDSLSDEEGRQQQKTADADPLQAPNVKPEQRPASRIPVVLTSKNALPQKSISLPSRLPTFEGSRPRSVFLPSPQLPPKPSHLKKIPKIASESFTGNDIITEEVPIKATAVTDSLSARKASSIPSSQPDLGEVLSNVPPPLPESPPPPLPSNIRDRIRNTKRKSYAVFPSETILKKSLPRRIRRPAQMQQFLNAADVGDSAS